MKTAKKETGPTRDVLLRYVQEIDRFANQLRETQERIKALQAECHEKREAFEAAKTAVREEQDVLVGQLQDLLVPLFDQMEPADEAQIEFPAPTAEQSLECLSFWRELLCESGAEEWGLRMATQIAGGRVPASFRELRQSIATAAREWIAKDLP